MRFTWQANILAETIERRTVLDTIDIGAGDAALWERLNRLHSPLPEGFHVVALDHSQREIKRAAARNLGFVDVYYGDFGRIVASLDRAGEEGERSPESIVSQRKFDLCVLSLSAAFVLVSPNSYMIINQLLRRFGGLLIFEYSERDPVSDAYRAALSWLRIPARELQHAERIIDTSMESITAAIETFTNFVVVERYCAEIAYDSLSSTTQRRFAQSLLFRIVCPTAYAARTEELTQWISAHLPALLGGVVARPLQARLFIRR